jgi:hypothetical protein
MSSQKVIAGEQLNVAPPEVSNFVSASTTLNMEIVVYPYDARAAAAQTQHLLADASSGKPLRRSKGVNELAAKASSMRGRKPSSGQAWASKLAASLTSLHD